MTSSLYAPRPNHSISACRACLMLGDIRESAALDERTLEGWAHDLVYDVLHYHLRGANEPTNRSYGP